MPGVYGFSIGPEPELAWHSRNIRANSTTVCNLRAE